jgi:hypothetical protein
MLGSIVAVGRTIEEREGGATKRWLSRPALCRDSKGRRLRRERRMGRREETARGDGREERGG